jgi:hypothetical protein
LCIILKYLLNSLTRAKKLFEFIPYRSFLLSLWFVNSTLYEWHHYAFTWSSFTGELKFYIDGWQWMNVTLPSTIGQTLPAGGTLVLGNLQVHLKKTTSQPPSFMI